MWSTVRRSGMAGATSLVIALAVVAAPVSAATTDSVPASAPDVPVTTTIPPGCPLPPSARAVFIGEVIASDVRTARFRVVQVRAGSLEGHQVGDLVDVDYEDDVRFLDTGETYLVGVDADESTGRLSSTVREPAPLFGGDQVAGVNDTPDDCPTVEDPIRTLMPDGTSVESGVVAPLLEDRNDLVAAVVLPAVWVFLGLVAVAAVKNLLWASGREVRLLARTRRGHADR